MNTKLSLIIILFVMMVNTVFAQEKYNNATFINGKISIEKFHDRVDLNGMQKAALLDLYTERLEVIFNMLPNIVFATDKNVTMSGFGIPNDKDINKALKQKNEATETYLETTKAFHKQILPFSNTNDLIEAILFYEATLKSIFTYNDFKSN